MRDGTCWIQATEMEETRGDCHNDDEKGWQTENKGAVCMGGLNSEP